MQVSEILEMKKGIKAKLMAATSLLLVSAILLSLTTYAWFILSTAPEVTEMQTTAGANGSLEIALQSGDTVSDIKNRVGDSSAVGSLKEANSTWGNVVDLSGNTYGLQGLSLLPARLNMNADGTVSKSSPLKMPLFGQDGRISELANLNSMRYDDTVKNYVAGQQNDHGVLVYADDESITNGTKDEKRLDRQGLIDTTREQIVKLRADLRADLVDTMDNNQQGISKILYNTVNLKEGLGENSNPNGSWYSQEDYKTILTLLASFSSVQEKAARSVRHALLACAAADTTNYPVDTQTGVSAELSALYAKYLTLPMKSDGEADETVYSIATANKAKLSTGENSAQTSLIAAYGSVMQAAEAADEVQTRISSAREKLLSPTIAQQAASPSLTEDEKKEFSRDISTSILELFSVKAATENSVYITNEQDPAKPPRTLANEINAKEKYFEIITEDKAEPQTCFYMLGGSGLFSAMATLAGDYESRSIKGVFPARKDYYATTRIFATISNPPEEEDVPYGETFGFSPENNTGCLQSVYAATSGLKADGSVKYVITSAERVNAYGYAVDLAFRSSGIGNLFLQQDAKDRVTGAAPANTPEGRLPSTSTTQGNGSTVEFLLRKSGQEYIEGSDSAMDRAKNLLQCLRVAFLKDAGEWTVLGVAAVDANSIKLSEADNGQTVKATAKLTLYTTAVVDGVLSLKDAKTDQNITQLGVNTPTAITALVYLDGDEVQNAFLTPDQLTSLTGSINLQFATDAKDLKPMEYTDFIIPENKKSEDGEEGSGQ